ncbi:hypothetical protein M0804_013473 [Polistes exclamans]|nr:hypothetical protein M0804_013473 [Polistes exclamans]
MCVYRCRGQIGRTPARNRKEVIPPTCCNVLVTTSFGICVGTENSDFALLKSVHNIANSTDQLSFMKKPVLPTTRVVIFKKKKVKVASERTRVRPDSHIADEAIGGYEDEVAEKKLVIRRKMEEIILFKGQLSKLQLDTFKKQEELDKREKEIELRKKELTHRVRRLELREDKIRRSVGEDFGGFRGLEHTRTPVDSFVTISRTPNFSRSSSPQPVQTRQPSFTPLEDNNDLRTENERLKQAVPKFDDHNISAFQFARACKSALDSLPTIYTNETETSLTRLLIDIDYTNGCLKFRNKRVPFAVDEKSVSLTIPKLELLDYGINTLPNSESNTSNSISADHNSDSSEYLHVLHTIFGSTFANATPKKEAPKSALTLIPSRAESVKSLLRLENLNTKKAEVEMSQHRNSSCLNHVQKNPMKRGGSFLKQLRQSVTAPSSVIAFEMYWDFLTQNLKRAR